MSDKEKVVQMFKKKTWADELNEWAKRKSYYDDRITLSLPLDLLEEVADITLVIVSQKMKNRKADSYKQCITEVKYDIQNLHMEGEIGIKTYLLFNQIFEELVDDKEIENLLEIDRNVDLI